MLEIYLLRRASCVCNAAWPFQHDLVAASSAPCLAEAGEAGLHNGSLSLRQSARLMRRSWQKTQRLSGAARGGPAHGGATHLPSARSVAQTL